MAERLKGFRGFRESMPPYPLVPSWQEHREKYEMKIRRWKLEY